MAQDFCNDRMRKACAVCGLQLKDAPLPAGQAREMKAKDGQTVVVRTNSMAAIEHIGIPLFNADMRLLMPSPVYDFLEYATLNWRYQITPNQLHLCKVVFRRGSWNTLVSSQLSQAECSISNEDDKYYVVSWFSDGNEIACVGVPIDYELLGNDTRRNMEREFVRLLEENNGPAALPQPSFISEDDLKVYGTGGLFVKEGEYHMLVELNQNVYYTLQTVREQVDTVIRGVAQTMVMEDILPVVVIDGEHPAESLGNLLMAGDGAVADVLLTLDFHLSSYHRRQLSIPMSRLRTTLTGEGCKLFFAGSGVNGGYAHGILFVVNAARGYNHLLNISMPLEQLTAFQPQAKADVYLYIPPIDKSHLYGKLPDKKSGEKFKH